MAESPELLAHILRTPAGSDCAIDPLGVPPGPVVRVMYTAPYLGIDAGTGEYAAQQPSALARRVDVQGVVVDEVTRLRIEGTDYIVERSERVSGAGDHWRRLVLRLAGP